MWTIDSIHLNKSLCPYIWHCPNKLLLERKIVTYKFIFKKILTVEEIFILLQYSVISKCLLVKIRLHVYYLLATMLISIPIDHNVYMKRTKKGNERIFRGILIFALKNCNPSGLADKYFPNKRRRVQRQVQTTFNYLAVIYKKLFGENFGTFQLISM